MMRRELYRDPVNGKLTGVCAGLACNRREDGYRIGCCIDRSDIANRVALRNVQHQVATLHAIEFIGGRYKRGRVGASRKVGRNHVSQGKHATRP